jgi:hypothetical protein
MDHQRALQRGVGVGLDQIEEPDSIDSLPFLQSLPSGRLADLRGMLIANLPPKLQTAAETRRNLQLINSLETKLPNLRISFQDKRTVRML